MFHSCYLFVILRISTIIVKYIHFNRAFLFIVFTGQSKQYFIPNSWEKNGEKY